MAVSLFDQLNQEAKLALPTQSDDGSFPGGHNGPYFDKETPVRNTAHWLFTLTCIYERTNDSSLLKSIENAINYLKSEAARPMGATFYCRTNPKKDLTNGVIGQAWVMEALLNAASILEREDCYDLAEKIYQLHPWIEKLKVWRVVNVDGSYSDFDPTFNHQLWFAAISSKLVNTPEALEQSKSFLNNAQKRLKLYKDGIVYHSSPFIEFKWKPNELINKINYLNRIKPLVKNDSQLYHKSSGYHAFNLYAFAILKESYPGHNIWKSKLIKKMLDVCYEKKFQNSQNDNKYSYPYNPTGIELAYVFEILKEDHTAAQFWIDRQLESTFENDSIMIKNSSDEITARARIYEAARLKNEYVINFPIQ